MTTLSQSNGDDVTTQNEILKDFADEMTMHGFKQIHGTRGVRRMVWIVGLIMTTVVVVMLFRESIIDYIGYKTYISTETKEDIHSLPFPTVTVCFTDTFLKRKHENFPVSITFAQYARLYAVVHGSKQDESDISLFESLNITSYETLLKALHISPDDVTRNPIGKIINNRKHCSFSKQNCAENDVKQVWMFDGKHSCLQFNSYEAGKVARKQDVIFSPFRVYLDMESSTPILKGGSFHYTAAYIHSYGVPHYLYYGKSSNEVLLDVVKLVSGQMTLVNLHLRTVKQLPAPYGTCGSKKLKLLKSYPYSINVCTLDCLLQYVIKQCGCIRFDFKEIIDQVPVCTTSQMIRCYIKETKIAANGSEPCLKTCSTECTRTYYDIITSRQPVPSHRDEAIGQVLGTTDGNNSLTQKYKNEHIFGIEVRYWRMKEIKETYTPVVTLTTLIGTIGGCIGLGMGLSVLTVIQILTFIFDSFKLCICSKIRRGKLPSSVEN